jgi:2-aminomuconate deaminase
MCDLNAFKICHMKCAGTWELDIAAQTKGCINNLWAQLASVGCDLSHVIDVTVFLTDMVHFPGYNKVYNSFFTSPHTGPTRTTVTVKALPHKNLLIEIKAVALAPKS